MSSNQPINKISILESILAITTGLVAMGLIFKVKVLFTIAVLVGISGLMIPPLARLIAWGWLKLSALLGYINSRILLGIIFYLFLLPVALMARISRKDNLQLKSKKSGSYFTERNHDYQASDFEHPW